MKHSTKNSVHRQNETEKYLPPGWIKLLELSLASLGIISSLLGGLIFLIYFFNIKYFPEFDFQSLLFFLGTTAFLGFILFFALGFFLLSPGVIWTHILDADFDIYPLISRNKIMLQKSFSPEKISIKDKRYVFDEKYQFQLRKVNYLFSKLRLCLIYLYTFINGFLLFSAFVLFGIKNVTIKHITNINSLNKSVPVININLTTKFIAYFLILLCILAFVLMILAIHKNYLKISENFERKLSLKRATFISFRLLYYSIINCTFCLTSWLLLSGFFSQSTDGARYFLPQQEILLIVSLTFISCLTTTLIMVFRYPKKKILLDFGIGLIILLFLTMQLNKMTVIPEKIMNNYGWGNIDNATIMVDRIGCQAIESMNIKVDGSCLKKDVIYKVEKICILSSIGRNYYLRFATCRLPKNSKFKPTEIVLARTNIISWSR